MEIRALKHKDIDQDMELWLNGNLDAHSFIHESYWLGHYEEVKEMMQQGELYVQEHQGKIIGFIGLQDGYIAGLFVHKDDRCMGIGKQLLTYAKRLYPYLCLHVYKRNQSALRFYEREGFLITQEQIEEESGQIEYVMEWRCR